MPAAGGRSGVTLPYGSAAALALVRHSSEDRAGAAQGSVRIAGSGRRPVPRSRPRTRSSAPAGLCPGLPAHPALKDVTARRAGRVDGGVLRVGCFKIKAGKFC